MGLALEEFVAGAVPAQNLVHAVIKDVIACLRGDSENSMALVLLVQHHGYKQGVRGKSAVFEIAFLQEHVVFTIASVGWIGPVLCFSVEVLSLTGAICAFMEVLMACNSLQRSGVMASAA